jgi:hypothetical protein
MKLQTYLLLSGLAVVFGLGVMVISVVSVRMSLSRDEPFLATDRYFYWSDRVYPDHVLYPALMFFDGVQLLMAPDESARAMLEIDYAGRRLQGAQALYEKQRVDLALITLNKSHQYLSKAIDKVTGGHLDRETRDYVWWWAAYIDGELEELMEQVDDAQRARISAMREEQKYLREQL